VLVFYDISHISLQNENAAGAKIDTAPTGTGFDVKRLYLVVDHKFNDVGSANLTTDAQFSTAKAAASPRDLFAPPRPPPTPGSRCHEQQA
jgi:hypothetical protein